MPENREGQMPNKEIKPEDSLAPEREAEAKSAQAASETVTSLMNETSDQSVEREKEVAEQAEEVVKEDQQEIAQVRQSFTAKESEATTVPSAPGQEGAQGIPTEMPVNLEEPAPETPAPQKSWWQSLFGG